MQEIGNPQFEQWSEQRENLLLLAGNSLSILWLLFIIEEQLQLWRRVHSPVEDDLDYLHISPSEFLHAGTILFIIGQSTYWYVHALISLIFYHFSII